MITDLTFKEIMDKILYYKYPQNAAFVTVWWWQIDEAAEIISLLKSLGYRVNSYRDRGETEIRFSYTKNVGKLSW